MTRQNYLSAIEAILFVSNKPIQGLTISEALGIDLETTKLLLVELEESLKDYGFNLLVTNKGYSFVPNEKCRRYFDKFIRKKHAFLSKELLEVIAILGKKDETKENIDKLRGVNSSRSLNTLIKKGYVKKLFSEGKVYYSISENLLKLINPEVRGIIKNPKLFRDGQS